MKQFSIVQLVFLVTFLMACNSQPPSPSDPKNATKTASVPTAMTCQQLDGKQYTITLTTGGKVEGTEILSFKNRHVASSECLKYGFEAAAFICMPQADGSVSFKSVMTSPKEGSMDWLGTATDNMIRGTILWIKAGQANISYSFEGPVK